MSKLVPISKTGFDKLHEKLLELEEERAKVSKAVGEARELGDLKENGDYIYGRERLGFIDGSLGELREKINTSEVFDCTKVQCDQARFGTVVSLLDINTQEKVTYQLLGPNDADYETGSISIYSPVGDAILGLKIGDKAAVIIPRGEFNFEVIDIASSKIE